MARVDQDDIADGTIEGFVGGNCAESTVRAQGIALRGGPIGSGQQLEQPFCRIGPDGRFELTAPDLAPRAEVFSGLARHPGPILSTVGFNSHRAAAEIWRHLQTSDTRLDEISEAAFAAAIRGLRPGALDFYRLLAGAGRRVFVTTSPQIAARPEHLPALRRFEAALLEANLEIGAILVDVRDALLRDGRVGEEFILQEGPVHVHGSAAWAALVVEELERVDRTGAGPERVRQGGTGAVPAS